MCCVTYRHTRSVSHRYTMSHTEYVHSHTHTDISSHALSHTKRQAHALTLTHRHAYSLSHIHTDICSRVLIDQQSYTHRHTRAHTKKHMHAPLPHVRTPTHVYTHAKTGLQTRCCHTLTHSRFVCGRGGMKREACKDNRQQQIPHVLHQPRTPQEI